MDTMRRRFLSAVAAAAGAVAAGFAAWPFIASLRPSDKAQALGGAVRVDLSEIAPEQQITVVWRGKPVWVLRRSEEMVQRMNQQISLDGLRDPHSRISSQQPAYAQNDNRSVRPDIFVAIGLCTHLGCVPLFEPDPASGTFDDGWTGGYFCPCHGSRYDFAGRVVKNVPAPTNLLVPPYYFIDDITFVIGADHESQNADADLVNEQ